MEEIYAEGAFKNFFLILDLEETLAAKWMKGFVDGSWDYLIKKAGMDRARVLGHTNDGYFTLYMAWEHRVCQCAKSFKPLFIVGNKDM